jgi:hypothetical protein
LEIMVAIMRERWATYQDAKDPAAAMGALEAAKSAAAYLCPRLAPAEAPVRIPAPTGSPSQQAQQVLASMAAGEMTPDQAAKVIQAIAAQMRILELDELEQRVKALEEAKRA